MRVALIVGIDHYSHISSLHGCVNDAQSVKAILERNGDGSKNFDCNLMTASSPADAVSRARLKDNVQHLFSTKNATIALFYFAGHGHIEASGGYLLATDSDRGDTGLPLSEVLTMANESPAANKIIILDSCHSGIAGTPPSTGGNALLFEGLTVLTASDEDQYATEENGKGLFTTLLVDALHGAAASITGDITLGSIYAHIDKSLGGWQQRPIFKTNVRQFVPLRKVTPAIALEDLRKIKDLFPNPGFEFKLAPTYEPEMKGRDPGMPPPVEAHTIVFAILQQYNRLNLLRPIDTPHMWNAAMESKSCKLTPLGEHYRALAKQGRF